MREPEHLLQAAGDLCLLPAQAYGIAQGNPRPNLAFSSGEMRLLLAIIPVAVTIFEDIDAIILAGRIGVCCEWHALALEPAISGAQRPVRQQWP